MTITREQTDELERYAKSFGPPQRGYDRSMAVDPTLILALIARNRELEAAVGLTRWLTDNDGWGKCYQCHRQAWGEEHEPDCIVLSLEVST